MKKFTVGTRVLVSETQYDPVQEVHLPIKVSGEVVGSKAASELYPRKPTYKKRYNGDKKKSKFPKDSVVYQVLVSGEKHPRNFHESQVE